jgi:bacterial/archaeal transporter family-2 protein
MDRGVAVLVTALVGGVVVTQAPLNSQLARYVGSLEASVVALAVSFTAVLMLSVVTGGIGGVRNVGDAPWHVALGGGLAGGLFIASLVWTVRALGVGGLTATLIASQLGVAVVIDHYGWLGVEKSPVTAGRLVGLALLALGAWLVIRD